MSGMRRMEASCAPTSYPGAHSRTGGFHAQAVAFNCRFTFEKPGQTYILPADEIYVMDSGMAAILGSSMDPLARSKGKTLVLDVATSHTLGAALDGEEIAGFFEYHTRDISLDRLDYLLQKLADGELEHEKILEEGGHGAYTRKAFGFDAVEIIVSTGPKRSLVEGSKLPITPGAPLGDNMMTGTVGLLEAIRKRKGLKPISYI